ncbi:MAG: DUF512 domain-containing protein [Firmicutes bacterium]|nr:DUF512 domain-containing protein [Bacillota bacterium]
MAREKGGLISGILPGSIAEELGIEVRDRLISINGQPLEDIIDYNFLSADELLQLELLAADGETYYCEVEKDEEEELGIMFSANVFDRIRSCANRCHFCFIDQLQPDPRPSMLLKDDDYRMSFLEGSFITGTNLIEKDFQRIERLHLSPLYFSVHVTDADLREQLMGTKRAREVMPTLQRLIDIGCELHTQLVICPGINDGEYLQKSLDDLSALYPGVISIAVVPVGLTKFNTKDDLRLFTPQEAAELIDAVEARQAEFRAKYGTSLVYIADELYIKAGRPFPPAAHYEGFPQIENGVGMAALFHQQWQSALHQLPESYDGGPIGLVTGINGAAVLRQLLPDLQKVQGLQLDILPLVSEFYGESVTASGLITGSDILRQVPRGKYERLLIPTNMLKFDEDIFLDDLTLEEVEAGLGQELEINLNNGAGLLRQLFRLPEEEPDEDFDADFDYDDEDYGVICEYIEDEEYIEEEEEE